MDHLSTKYFRKQISFVEGNSRRRSGTRDQQVGNHTRIVLVPVPPLGLRFHIGALRLPPLTGHLVNVSVVAVLEDEVNATTFVAVVVIIGLPKRSEERRVGKEG